MGIVLENQQRAHRQQLCNHLKNATRGFTSLILQYETNRKEPAVNMAASYTHSAATNKAVLDRYMRLPQPDDNRGCSIRVPRSVAEERKGYLEDRRPASNADPYQVTNVIVRTTCLDQ